MSLGGAPIEDTLDALRTIVSSTHEMNTLAKRLKGQLEALAWQERSRLNPTPLALEARKHVLTVNLLTQDRDASEGQIYVPGGDVVLVHNRLWIDDGYGSTRVLEATSDPRVWNAVHASLPPLTPTLGPEKPIAGPSIQSIYRVRYQHYDNHGKLVWKSLKLTPDELGEWKRKGLRLKAMNNALSYDDTVWDAEMVFPDGTPSASVAA
jgi:hypothetical protein